MKSGIAVVGRYAPSWVSARFAEWFLRPADAMALSALLPPARATAIVDRLSGDYLAEACLSVKVQELEAMAAVISASSAARITHILAARQAYPTLGQLLAYLPDATLRHTTVLLDAPGHMLRIALAADDPQRLSPAILGLPPEQLPAILQTAETDGLWADTFAMIQALDEPARRRLGQLLAQHPATVLGSFMRAAVAHNSWPDLLNIWLLLDDGQKRTLADKAAAQPDDLLLAFVSSAKRRRKMRPVLHFVQHMHVEHQRRLVLMAQKHGVDITAVL